MNILEILVLNFQFSLHASFLFINNFHAVYFKKIYKHAPHERNMTPSKTNIPIDYKGQQSYKCPRNATRQPRNLLKYHYTSVMNENFSHTRTLLGFLENLSWPS